MIGTTFLIVLWQGGFRFPRGQLSLGALITFNTYLGFLGLADDRLGLGNEYFPARGSFDEPPELNSRRQSANR